MKDEGGAEKEHWLGELTEQDKLLGKRATRIIDILCVLAFVACAGIAIFVFLSVPFGTRMDYSGQFGRNGIPMPVAMLVTLVALFLFWRGGKKPDAHHMGKGGRIVLYILGPAIVVGCVAGQLVMAQSILG
ncbi:hypothetical protein J2M53_09930 [Arthrobacter sp. zg-ZUI100]|uniref:hypothetical protein n=1 Tax=Arthrobacter jiangjiafuii TaxID=2817475 RepID=UPI001AEE3FFF|nr:hypothetical protein [Arthrobacter jiangjiafuii]MBP3036568.1 hypothetical protein [Arthrobacter jiangjiafuii]